MEQLLQAAELLLLVVLAILQLGRWSKQTEDGPVDALRIARDVQRKVDDTAEDLRKHKHAWNNYLQTQYTELDKVYARKREVELELQKLSLRLDVEENRIDSLENRIRILP